MCSCGCIYVTSALDPDEFYKSLPKCFTVRNWNMFLSHKMFIIHLYFTPDKFHLLFERKTSERVQVLCSISKNPQWLKSDNRVGTEPTAFSPRSYVAVIDLLIHLYNNRIRNHKLEFFFFFWHLMPWRISCTCQVVVWWFLLSLMSSVSSVGDFSIVT